MRYIGATNFMIRAPFLVEGLLLGLLGALVPLGGIWVLYEKGMLYLEENYSMITGLVEPLALGTIFPYMTGGSFNVRRRNRTFSKLCDDSAPFESLDRINEGI